MTLLIALGVIAVATAATLVSLRIVAQESELQGRERHSREAFFAAEAGLAEGREALAGMLGGDWNYNNVFTTLATPHKSMPGFDTQGAVSETGFVGNTYSWYEVIPNTPYTLRASSGAFAPAYAVARRELRDANNKPFLSFPDQANVSYRVFVHDDTDESGGIDKPTEDINGAVWLVAVGEVSGSTGEVLARSVVRALVVTGRGPPAADGYSGQGGCGADKSGCSVEQSPPDVSKGGYLP